jgi:hypothetical protein
MGEARVWHKRARRPSSDERSQQADGDRWLIHAEKQQQQEASKKRTVARRREERLDKDTTP